LKASEIRKVALEFGEEAKIGSTIVIDGVTLPYRPVGLMGYHVSQQELGFQMMRSSMLPFMLVGAIEAVGGLRSDTSRKLHANFDKLDEIEIGDGPYNVYLKDSKYFPINSNNSSIAAQAMLDPGKGGIDVVPEVAIVHYANPVLSFQDQKAIMEAYQNLKFVAVIDPWLSETADYYADVVLPAATMEKYEGPMSVTDGYTDAKTMRIPPMEPLGQSKGEIDIYIELCEKAEMLYGEGGYIDQINKALKFNETYALPLDEKPDVRDIFDRWSMQEGYEGGIEFFETVGVSTKPIATDKLYAPAWDPPYGGIRHRLYGESLQGYQKTMKEKGAGPFYYRQYTAFPTWMVPTMEGSPDEFDLYLISRKHIEHKQSRTTFVPILNELMPKQGLEINPETAKSRDIEDGDEVTVWSHNAVTDETRSVKTKAVYLESIRPDTVSLSHHFGFWTNPITEGQGPTPNTIFFSGEGYVSNTADQSYQVKVRVSK
jgi:anaerobic selenocysteine-containing dehydrogenase